MDPFGPIESIVEQTMPVNISIKNVPDALAAKLRARAQRNRRSLQRELIVILEQAASEHATAPEAERESAVQPLSIEEVADRARTLFPEGTPSSVAFIRQQRDRRFGPRWAGSDRKSGKQ